MAGSLNKVTLIGNLGKDPEIRTMQNGSEVANLALATHESWKDKETGEKKEKTEWHRIVIFSPGLIGVARNYLRKGSKIYIEGQLETRKWQDNSGKDTYTTEIVLRGFDAKMMMLDSKGFDSNQVSATHDQEKGNGYQPEPLDDEIPF